MTLSSRLIAGWFGVVGCGAAAIGADLLAVTAACRRGAAAGSPRRRHSAPPARPELGALPCAGLAPHTPVAALIAARFAGWNAGCRGPFGRLELPMMQYWRPARALH